MIRHDNSYSRFIALIKILLPLLALGILSTLFLFSRGTDGTYSIPLSEGDIAERARQPRITAPNFAGVTQNGTAVSVRAESAIPDAGNTGTLEAQNLEASIDTPGGTRFNIISERGVLNGARREFLLSGHVILESSTGLSVTTENLTTRLDGTLMQSPGEIHAHSPFGEFSADAMRLTLADPQNNSYVLVFNGGVKLVYTPQN